MTLSVSGISEVIKVAFLQRLQQHTQERFRNRDCVCRLIEAIGHDLGGADPTTRATLAIANTVRNAGLTLVITVLNFTKAEILPTIIVYALIAALTVTIYHNRSKHIITSVKE